MVVHSWLCISCLIPTTDAADVHDMPDLLLAGTRRDPWPAIIHREKNPDTSWVQGGAEEPG
jgi:hypothetical protein